MTACSRMEINPMIPVTNQLFVSSLCSVTPQLLQDVIQIHEAFVQFVGRPQLKNSNLWLKTGSCSASSECGTKS